MQGRKSPEAIVAIDIIITNVKQNEKMELKRRNIFYIYIAIKFFYTCQYLFYPKKSQD